MSTNPITWILVTVKGRPQMTERCVAALLDRTPGERRLFVVDNGSRDATLDYLYRKFRNGDVHRLLCNKVDTLPQWEKSYAICQAVHALRMETYDYFAWVDNDVEVKNGWLKVAHLVLCGLPQVAVASMHNDKYQEGRHETASTIEVGGVPVRLKETANGALWVVRREFFDFYGLPPTGLGITSDGTEDWYYCQEMQRRKMMFAVVDGYSEHLGYKRSVKKEALRNGA
ncbi:hypothetical protein LCGC14_2061170 [marine sediment metagenome]|uniref:Glycosyltransferase 2-like domain-containing protein n=1 Tax=marine sediment metagenome TaxID=412755 RepID=A0A0F9ELC1_9ZZZZ